MTRKHFHVLTTAALGASVALGGSLLMVGGADAADHLDPPMRTGLDASPERDANADIADVFAWHVGTGAAATLVTAITFAGPSDPSDDQALPCDRDVLYVLHISNDDDPEPEIDIEARFGSDDVGNCFVEVENLPGMDDPVVAPEGLTTRRGDVTVYAGLREDPFFFDLQGFQMTLMDGSLHFVNDRDFFAGKNVAALVFEVPLPVTLGGGDTLDIWTTTARIGS